MFYSLVSLLAWARNLVKDLILWLSVSFRLVYYFESTENLVRSSNCDILAMIGKSDMYINDSFKMHPQGNLRTTHVFIHNNYCNEDLTQILKSEAKWKTPKLL